MSILAGSWVGSGHGGEKKLVHTCWGSNRDFPIVQPVVSSSLCCLNCATWIIPQNTTARYFPDTCRVVSHPVEEDGVWATLCTCDHEAIGSSCNCYFILCVLFSCVFLLCSWGSGVLSLRWSAGWVKLATDPDLVSRLSKGWSYTSVSPACFHCVHRGNFTLFYIFIMVVPFLPLYLACFFSFPSFRPPALSLTVSMEGNFLTFRKNVMSSFSRVTKVSE